MQYELDGGAAWVAQKVVAGDAPDELSFEYLRGSGMDEHIEREAGKLGFDGFEDVG